MKQAKFEIFRYKTIQSVFLNREVIFDLIVPIGLDAGKLCPTIYMNDGQDFDQLNLPETLEKHYTHNGVPFIFIGIHTNERRLSEYGTSFYPDYKNRGSKATDYMSFIISEMMPWVRKNTASSDLPENNAFCGFSLGGLSAMDIVWENPHLFSKAGVFSGSFWWRDKGYEEGFDEDNDRIMHKKIRNSNHKNGLSFWFECGTADETADRNNNGIIDSIDDTQDVIKELKNKGYADADIRYEEIAGGEHNFNTWSKVFPDFLTWVFKD
ncbi:MAG TPA: alpha/beta hydrolase-fold protein [Leadbetterella sp.]|nr:alpha/beta hydrolase-fold protein [Leadbetterella sp.]